MSHAGNALLAEVADKAGLTRALSLRLVGLGDAAVMIRIESRDS